MKDLELIESSLITTFFIVFNSYYVYNIKPKVGGIMMEIRNFTEEHLKKYDTAFRYVCNELDVIDGKYYIIGKGEEEQLLYRYDNVFCVFSIDEENDTCVDMFTVDENYKMKELGTTDYEVTFTDQYPIFFDRKTNHSHIVTILQRPNNEVDVDGYNGLLSYLEYSPENDSRSIINYQYSYNPNLNRIYEFRLKNPFQFVIEKHVSNLIHSKKYFVSRNFEDNSFATDLMIIKDYGLTEFLQRGNFHLMNNKGEKRYYRMLCKSFNDYAITLFPLCKQHTVDEMNELLVKIGHNTNIPAFIIDFYNGNYSKLDEYNEIISLMKKIEQMDIEPVTLKYERGDMND